LAAALISIFASNPLFSAVKLPRIIGDNMVLQRDQALPIWGPAEKGEEITVKIADQTVTTKAGADGKWKVSLKKLKVGDPLEMTVRGSSGDEIKVKNILVGEVWLCSGQSNMEMGVGACDNANEEVAKADYPNIRLFMVPNTRATEPAADVNAEWLPCSPQNIAVNGWAGFSGAGYYFGRQLHKELKVPVGLIDSTWGGTPAEQWTSKKTLEADAALKPLLQKHPDTCTLYNAMIAPIVPFGIRGAIWYQGEANVPDAYLYRTLLPAMIGNWRTDWAQGDFPFGIVQLAPFDYGQQEPAWWAELCESQYLTSKNVPNVGLAVTVDIGNIKDVHPTNKQDVGKRLALWAMAKVYGKAKDVIYSGPVYKAMKVEGGRIRMEFDHLGGGLVARDGKPLTEFTIAGDDKKFVPATAMIDGDNIVVSSPEVAAPVAVRFAWRDDCSPNLSNKAGLPCGPFRTDTWKSLTDR
jgi:sialate O-acetylesterase